MQQPQSIFSKFPIIELNEEFYMRQYRVSDKKDYFDYLLDDEVIKYIPEECIPRTMERAAEELHYVMELYNQCRSIYWAIALKKNDRLAGSCGFNYWSRDHHRAEISYDLAREHWGKGVITEAVKKACSFGFFQMNLNRIEATVIPDNVGSLKVLEKTGFEKEGVLREQKLLHGKFRDAEIYSLLKKDFMGF